MPQSANPDAFRSSAVGYDARWLWINISGPLQKDRFYSFSLSELNEPITPALGYPLTDPFVELTHLGVPQNAERFGYGAAGKCIYCGSLTYASGIDRELGEEHIIPGGLGAAAILPKASCRKHEKITNKIETKILQNLFDPTRKHRDIRGRSKRPLLKGNFPVFRTVDGVQLGTSLPIKDHPTVLFLPRLGPPGILTGRPNELHGVIGIWMANINAHAETLDRQKITSFSSPFVDTIRLAQLFAKIAHAYTAAEVLVENFQPMLVKFIELDLGGMENEEMRYQFWGGDIAGPPPTPFLHELGLGVVETASRAFLVARIRLFAYLGAPVYYVVVGAISEVRRNAVMARLSQNNSRTHPR